MGSHFCFCNIFVHWVGEIQTHKQIAKMLLKYDWRNLQNIIAARYKDYFAYG